MLRTSGARQVGARPVRRVGETTQPGNASSIRPPRVVELGSIHRPEHPGRVRSTSGNELGINRYAWCVGCNPGTRLNGPSAGLSFNRGEELAVVGGPANKPNGVWRGVCVVCGSLGISQIQTR